MSRNATIKLDNMEIIKQFLENKTAVISLSIGLILLLGLILVLYKDIIKKYFSKLKNF